MTYVLSDPTYQALSAACWADPVARHPLMDWLDEFGGFRDLWLAHKSGGGGDGSGSSGDSGSGSGGGDGFMLCLSDTLPLREAMMFQVGDMVLVFLQSGYSPLALMGTVTQLIGVEGAELGPNTVNVRWCDDARWGDLAAGDLSVAQNVVHYGATRFARCRDVRIAKAIPPVS